MSSNPNTHLETSWNALKYFNLYRFSITALFTALVWGERLPEPLGTYDAVLFSAVVHTYLLLAIAIGCCIRLRYPKYHLQVIGQVYLDLIAVSLMMYASNGLSSGFGMLLVITVAGGSILQGSRVAITFAASATLIVLGHELYIQWMHHTPTPNYLHAGFLGITFFMTAILGQRLSAKTQHSEALAKQHAIELKNLARLNEYIVQHIQAGLIVLDEKLRVQLVNKAAKTLLGLPRDLDNKTLDKEAPELIKHLNNWTWDERAAFNRAGPQVVTFSPAKGIANVQVSFTRLNFGSISSVLILVEDATQIRQRAQHLKVASLGRLSASIAHEIRNPLGAISHASQLLSESKSLLHEDERLINIIIDQSNRVNRIIENMMKISKREPAIPSNVSITTWLQNFIEEFSSHNQLRQSDIKFKVLPEPAIIKIDPSQMHQVMWNLSENALRYSKTVPLIEYSVGEGVDRFFIDVIDQGGGISEDIMPQLFEPFITTYKDGSGLGLYISQELCEANQVTLVLHKNTPAGCCFRLHFPVADTLATVH